MLLLFQFFLGVCVFYRSKTTWSQNLSRQSTVGPPTSSTAGPDVSDDKSLNGSDTRTGLKTLEPDVSPIRKGRKRVVSGRSRGGGRVRGRGT